MPVSYDVTLEYLFEYLFEHSARYGIFTNIIKEKSFLIIEGTAPFMHLLTSLFTWFSRQVTRDGR